MRFSVSIACALVITGMVWLQRPGLQPTLFHDPVTNREWDSTGFHPLRTGHEVLHLDMDCGACWRKGRVGEPSSWQRVIDQEEAPLSVFPVNSDSGILGVALKHAAARNPGVVSVVDEALGLNSVLDIRVRLVNDGWPPDKRIVANRILASLGGGAIPTLRELREERTGYAKLSVVSVLCLSDRKAYVTVPDSLKLLNHNDPVIRAVTLRSLETVW